MLDQNKLQKAEQVTRIKNLGSMLEEENYTELRYVAGSSMRGE